MRWFPVWRLQRASRFSFSTYTTLGFGDIVATGPLRLLAGIEGITGLVLIAWTASFAYVEMGHYWGNGEEEEEG